LAWGSIARKQVLWTIARSNAIPWKDSWQRPCLAGIEVFVNLVGNSDSAIDFIPPKFIHLMIILFFRFT
jgi:hypothetical protein